MSTVSVIMPCYNHGRFVAESIGSILNQSHRELELVVVDDCSRDNSRSVVSDWACKDSRIKLILHERNAGASASRNDGLRASRGEFIAFCDADDLWLATKLTAQIEMLQSNPAYDVAYSDAVLVDENGTSLGRRFSEIFPPPQASSGWLYHELCLRNFINIQTVLMRRKCFLRTGYFDEAIKWVEDWWYWIQASTQHHFLYCEQPLAKYRVHAKSTNLTQRRGYHVNRLKVFKRVLKECPDLPRGRAAEIWYHIAMCLYYLGKRKLGRRVLWKALGFSLHSRCRARHSVRTVLRLLSAVPKAEERCRNAARGGS